MKPLTDDEIVALEAKSSDAAKPLSDADIIAMEKQAAAEKEAKRSTYDRAVESLKYGAKGVFQGLKDPFLALEQMVVPKGSILDEVIKDQLAEYEKSREGRGMDVGRILGNVVNPATLVPASRLPAAASLAGKVAQGMGVGAASGVLAPTQEEDFWKEKAKQAGMGAAVGAALPVGQELLSRTVAPRLSPNVRLLHEEGVGMTPGQMLGGGAKALEDKISAMPIVGDLINAARREGIKDLNVAAGNRAMAPVGGKVTSKPGAEMMTEINDALSAGYDKFIQNAHLSAKPSPTGSTLPTVPGGAQPTSYLDDLANLRANMVRGNVPQEQLNFFDKVMSDMRALGTPQGNMSGDSANKAIQYLGNISKTLDKAASTNPWWLSIKDATKQSRAILLDHLERQNPQLAKEFQKTREGWANLSILKSAARDSADQIFPPGKLSEAVRNNALSQQGKAIGTGNLSRNQALMQDLSNAALSILPTTVPKSETAGRLLLDTALLGGGSSVIFGPHSLGVLALLAAPYAPGANRVVQSLIAGGHKWRKPIGDAISSVKVPVGGLALASARDNEKWPED